MAERFIVVAKVSVKKNKSVSLRISNQIVQGDGISPGMMGGATSFTDDTVETRTSSCKLQEGQTLQGFQGGLIIDSACLSCIFHGVTCLASK